MKEKFKYVKLSIEFRHHILCLWRTDSFNIVSPPDKLDKFCESFSCESHISISRQLAASGRD